MTSSRLLGFGLAASLAGCIADVPVTTSSRTYLAPEQSGALSNRAPLEVAREVTRLFEVRGFAMADQREAAGGTLVLKLIKTARPLAADKDDGALVGARDVGSVFYVWVAPAAGGSAVSMVGKPTLNGVEPCSKDTPELACTPLSVNDRFAATYMSGHNEADLVHGVLSELALEGFVSGARAQR